MIILWTLYQQSTALIFIKILLIRLKIKIYCLLKSFCIYKFRRIKSSFFSVQCIKINMGNLWYQYYVIWMNKTVVYRSMNFYTQQIHVPLGHLWTYRRCPWFWGWFWSPLVRFLILPLPHYPCGHMHHRLWP